MQSQETNNANTIIELRGITHRYGERAVLSDVDLTVNKGDFIAITGPNGGGKTTLLKIMLRLLRPTLGAVEYRSEGKIVKRLNVGYLPQKNMIDSRFPITVREVVQSGLITRSGAIGRASAEQSAMVTAMLEQMSVYNLAERAIGELSGGQMQRALLGRALISKPELLVLDEPLSYVDKQFEHRIYSLIEKIAPTTTIVLVSHEMTGIAPLASRHLIVDGTVTTCHAHAHFSRSDCD